MLSASSVSIVGTRISAMALPWFVLTETDSPTLTGLVLMFEMAPYIVSKALGGPLVDRHGPRLVSVTTDVTSGLLIALVPVLHLTGQLALPDRMPLLLVVVAAVGVVRGPGDGARNALIPAVADDARLSLERVSGLDGTVDRASGLFAAGAGGLLIAAFGAAETVALNAGAFLLSAVIVATTAPRPAAVTAASPDLGRRGGVSAYAGELREGAAYIRREPLLRSVVAMIAVTNLLDAALQSVLLPVWLRDNGYGARELGLLGMTFGIAAALSSLVATTAAGRFSRRWAYLIGFTLGGAPRFVVMALGAPLWVVVAVAAVSGLGAGFINPVIGAVFFERTPRPLVGRVGSLADSLAWAGIPLGGVAAGAAITALGLAPAIVLAGAAYFVATTVPGLRPEWRDMDRGDDDDGRAAVADASAGRRPSTASAEQAEAEGIAPRV
jgi:MFS family permease